MFKGCFTALITPFRDGKVDDSAFQSFVDWQIKEGIHGVFPCGTTGESPTLSHQEHMRVSELCIEVAKGRVPTIAGTGSNSTEEAIRLAQHAENAGADAQVVVTPYYNKPTQEGLYRHFKAIHDSCGLPIIIYNIPPPARRSASMAAAICSNVLQGCFEVSSEKANKTRASESDHVLIGTYQTGDRAKDALIRMPRRRIQILRTGRVNRHRSHS